MERFIYYSGQRDWDEDDFDYLNSFLTKIFQYKDKDVNKYRLSTMNYYAMEDTTRAIIKAILCQHKMLNKIIKEYPNLKKIKDVQPLKEKLYLSKEPCHLFEEYEKLNIIV